MARTTLRNLDPNDLSWIAVEYALERFVGHDPEETRLSTGFGTALFSFDSESPIIIGFWGV